MNQITYIVYHFWVLVVYHTYCVPGWVFFYFFFPVQNTERISLILARLAQRKNFSQFLDGLQKVFYIFEKKTTKIQHKNQRLACKVLKLSYKFKKFLTYWISRCQTCIAWFLFRIKWKFTANKRWNNENQTEKTKNIEKFSENN